MSIVRGILEEKEPKWNSISNSMRAVSFDEAWFNFHYHIQSPSFDLQWKNSEKMIIYLNLHIAWHPTMPWL